MKILQPLGDIKNLAGRVSIGKDKGMKLASYQGFFVDIRVFTEVLDGISRVKPRGQQSQTLHRGT